MDREERNAKILELYREGLSQEVVGEMFGLSQQTISWILKREKFAGELCAKKAARDAELAARDTEMARLYREGHTLRALSARFGLTYQGVHWVLRRDGVQMERRKTGRPRRVEDAKESPGA